jgi:hypothetical protein
MEMEAAIITGIISAGAIIVTALIKLQPIKILEKNGYIGIAECHARHEGVQQLLERISADLNRLREEIRGDGR